MNLYKKLFFLSFTLLQGSLLVAMQDAKTRAEVKATAEAAKSKYFVLHDQRVLIPKDVAAQVTIQAPALGIAALDTDEEEILLSNYSAHNPSCTIADVQRLVASLGIREELLSAHLNNYTLPELMELTKLSNYAGSQKFTDNLIAYLPQKALTMVTAQGNNTPLQEVIRLLGGNLNGNLFEGLGEKHSALLKQSCLQLTQDWDHTKIDTGSSQRLLQATMAPFDNDRGGDMGGAFMTISPQGRYLALVAEKPGRIQQGRRIAGSDERLYFYEKIDQEWNLLQEQPCNSRIASYAWSPDGSKLAFGNGGIAIIFERGADNKFMRRDIDLDWSPALTTIYLGRFQPSDFYISWHPSNNSLTIINDIGRLENAPHIQITQQEDGTWQAAPMQQTNLDIFMPHCEAKEIPKSDNLGFMEFAMQPLPAHHATDRKMVGMYHIDQKGKVLRELSVNELLFIAAYQQMLQANPARKLTPEDIKILNDFIAAKPVVGAAIRNKLINTPAVATPAAIQEKRNADSLRNKYQRFFESNPKTCAFLTVCAAVVGCKLMHKAWVNRKKLKRPTMPAWLAKLFGKQPVPVK